MKIKRLLVYLLICYFLMMISNSHAGYCLSRPDVQAYIQHLVRQYDFNEEKLQRLFCAVTINEEVITRLKKPAEAKPWYQYRKIFITPDRINKGVAYWQQHEKTLALAEEKYGVPASVIVAIIGVETKYGDNKGTFPVFNTLVTLAFNYGPRADFFRSELTQYLLLARENRLPPLLLKGSYAGAVGLPQFMPSSYRHYAVDFYHKGFTDLFENNADAIGSIGNYLYKHGWKSGEPVAIPATVQGDGCLALIQKKYKPNLTETDLARYNVTPEKPLHSKVTFIRLEDEHSYEHWLGLQNFYVISTYNKSALYVMAVRELAKHISEQMHHAHKEIAVIESPDCPPCHDEPGCSM
jgi:membrane-bound lytic murein transglycosylase B